MYIKNQSGAAPILILIAIIGIVAFLAVANSAPLKNSLLSSLFPKETSQASTSFLETFDGDPTAPIPLGGLAGHTRLPNWDFQVHSRDGGTFLNLESMNAMHGPDCGAPPASHVNNTYEGAVFLCRNHIMTAIQAGGYGLIVMTPNQMVDFTNGSATIQWEMSTNRMSTRDWPDVWISPFLESVPLPFDPNMGSVDLQGAANHAIHVDATNNLNAWIVGSVINEVVTEYNSPYTTEPLNANVATGTNQDATRQTFKLTLSRTHYKLERLASTTAPAAVYFDGDVPDIGFTQGVVQFGHHSYNPTKDGGEAGTWHWDNISINPAVPFTIIHANKRYVTDTNGNNAAITFNAPAPANSYLKFNAVGRIEYSLNNGATWTAPAKQVFLGKEETTSPYMIAIPQGTQTVNLRFSADDWYHCGFGCQAKDFAIWSMNPLCTGQGCPTTAPTPTPSPSPSPSPLSTGSITVDFNSKATGGLTGEFPAGLLNWGPNWIVAGPFGQLNSNSVSFSNATVTQSTISVIGGNRTLTSLQAYNGGSSASTITLSCAGNTIKTQSVAAGTLATIITGWTNPCSTITIASSNTWDTNFDNLILGPVASQSPSPSPSPAKIGDISGPTGSRDGVVDMWDYNQLLTDLINNPKDPNAKGNIDGIVTSQGIAVDIFDYNLLLGNFGK